MSPRTGRLASAGLPVGEQSHRSAGEQAATIGCSRATVQDSTDDFTVGSMRAYATRRAAVAGEQDGTRDGMLGPGHTDKPPDTWPDGDMDGRLASVCLQTARLAQAGPWVGTQPPELDQRASCNDFADNDLDDCQLIDRESANVITTSRSTYSIEQETCFDRDDMSSVDDEGVDWTAEVTMAGMYDHVQPIIDSLPLELSNK